VDLRRQLAVLRSRTRLIVGSVLLAAIASALVSLALPKVYQSRVTLVVGQSLAAVNPDINQLLVSQKLSETYAEVARTDPVLQAVSNELGLGVTPDNLRGRVSTDAPRDITLLRITATDADPNQAARIANEVANQLIKLSPTLQGRNPAIEQSIASNLTALQQVIDDTQARISTLLNVSSRTNAQDQELADLQARLVTLRQTYVTLLGISTGSAANFLTVVEPARAASDPASPRMPINTAIGALMGLLVALGLALFIDHMDDTVKTPEIAGEVTGLPTLGTIVRMRLANGREKFYSLPTLLYPRSRGAEAFRTLRTNLDFAHVDEPVKTILVSSAGQSEGKTTVSANLAIALGQSGRSTILVDADLRVPELHDYFQLTNDQGLTSLLRDETLPVSAVARETEEPRLRVVTSGPVPPNPAELLGSQRMRGVIERLKKAADVVVFDSPPLSAVTDAAILATAVDGTLLVVDAHRTRRDVARGGADALKRVGARVLGVVLNRVSGGTLDVYGPSYYEDDRTARPKSRTGSKAREPRPSTPRAARAPGGATSATGAAATAGSVAAGSVAASVARPPSASMAPVAPRSAAATSPYSMGSPSVARSPVAPASPVAPPDSANPAGPRPTLVPPSPTASTAPAATAFPLAAAPPLGAQPAPGAISSPWGAGPTEAPPVSAPPKVVTPRVATIATPNPKPAPVRASAPASPVPSAGLNVGPTTADPGSGGNGTSPRKRRSAPKSDSNGPPNAQATKERRPRKTDRKADPVPAQNANATGEGPKGESAGDGVALAAVGGKTQPVDGSAPAAGAQAEPAIGGNAEPIVDPDADAGADPKPSSADPAGQPKRQTSRRRQPRPAS
jgi:capsular exopolysaccharide synthesis family protein